MPAWAAIPIAVTGVSLIVAVFGYYWDVSTHIDNGRDLGPFANPSHYFILFGLAGIALAGGLSLVSGCDEDTPSSVALRDGWEVPVGGLLLTLCGVVAVGQTPLYRVPVAESRRSGRCAFPRKRLPTSSRPPDGPGRRRGRRFAVGASSFATGCPTSGPGVVSGSTRHDAIDSFAA